jgi:ribosomal protein S18 acetylase RimI-like enzyme
VPAAVLLNDYFVRTRRALAADSAYLALLAVDPDAQGRGFGGELIDDAIALGRSSGARAIGLDTENRANVTLYQRYGFSLDRELSLEAMPVFVMSCPLPASPTPAAR